jgi:hypothetical protein
LSGLRSLPRSALVGAAALTSTLAAFAQEPVRYTRAQSSYMEGCGGCHGILGSSSKKDIPELRGAVGWFMCTPEGREYIVRLPNVAFAAVDDAGLADLMNFVVFSFGGDSVPAGVVPYTANEVGALRRRPLKNQPLAQMRLAILKNAFENCSRNGDKRMFREQSVAGRSCIGAATCAGFYSSR